jgi:hypothetical protein
LGSSYGVGDFRELLTNISQQPYDEDDLESIRPQKVMRYYQAMAQNYSSTEETEKVQLNLALESLNWNKIPSTRWMMGTLKGNVQAMKLMEQ